MGESRTLIDARKEEFDKHANEARSIANAALHDLDVALGIAPPETAEAEVAAPQASRDERVKSAGDFMATLDQLIKTEAA